MESGRSARSRLFALIGSVLVLALGLAACGSSDDDTGGGETTSGTSAESTGGGGDTLAVAQKQLDEAYAGRFTEPPSAPNPAAENKTVWFISPGQASPNAAYGWKAYKQGAEAIGWTPQLYDAKLDPANFSIGIRQAVASGADGIVTDAIDCSLAKSALQEAKAAGVPTVTFLGFDCNEIDPSEEALYTAPISLGDRYKDWPDAFRAWGSDMAAWTIAVTDAEANVLNFTNTEYGIITNTVEGYSERMAECDTCVTNDIQWVLAEAGTDTTNKVKDLLVKEPETNVVQDALNPLLGFTNGVVQSGKTGEVKVVGGLGLPEDFEAIQEEMGLTALGAWPFVWWAWAAIDTLNSHFNGKPVEDSGLGWQMVDAENNLPSGTDFESPVDFEAAYLKRWGKG
jgi:ribose transport system substrate-binding protein